MDTKLTTKIGNFLKLEHPTDKQIIDAALILLQIDPSRERGVYNSALKRPQSLLPWVRADLKKHYNIRIKGLTTADTKKFVEETNLTIKETLSVKPEGVELQDEESLIIPILETKGKRPDHDQLPEKIQELWDRNSKRWKKIRQLHAELAAMIDKPDYQPCDGVEACTVLREADADLRNDYKLYDEFVLDAGDGQINEIDSVDKNIDTVKEVQKARTAVTRGLSRKTQDENSIEKIQNAVNILFSLNQKMKAEQIDKLKAIGISIPGTTANA